MRRMDARCAGLARSSTIGTAWPCPSWIGPGHENTPPNISPSSLVSPWWPSSITTPTTASQLPWVGRALNWQGQPYEQLQWEKFRPLRCHLPSAIVASRSLFPSRHIDSAPRPLPEGPIIHFCASKAREGQHLDCCPKRSLDPITTGRRRMIEKTCEIENSIPSALS